MMGPLETGKRGQLLVSIIIPTYNAAQFLPDAVASIRAQTFQPALGIIIVDDGSTDDTAVVVQQLGPDIRYIYQENSSPAIARNRGQKAAKGDLISFLDTDDLYPANKFQLQVKRLLNDPAVDVVQGRKFIFPAQFLPVDLFPIFFELSPRRLRRHHLVGHSPTSLAPR